MELGDKVTIGGRTMLRPGFSLVGLTGRIVASRYDAPPGTRAVWMDWEEFGYDDPDLPQVVNVPSIHLQIADAPSADVPNAAPESKSPLTSVSQPALLPTTAPATKSETIKPESEESEEERPRLRLI